MARKRNTVRVAEQIKSKRMRNVFSQTYDANYAQKTKSKQIDKDIQYLRNTLYRSRKAFERRGLGPQTDKYFDTALKNIRLSKSMTPQEKTEILNAAVKYSREHRLTASLFDIQKQLTLDALQSDEFSSVVRQSREMNSKKDVGVNDLTDQQLYQVFEALGEIRKGLGKYEKSVDQGSGDEFDAAIEVVYSMYNDSSDWKYNENLSMGDNILAYLKTAKTKVSGKVFR